MAESSLSFKPDKVGPFSSRREEEYNVRMREIIERRNDCEIGTEAKLLQNEMTTKESENLVANKTIGFFCEAFHF